ncbi:hypothetical protein LCGC14_0944490 [marine sediment metagenome]|uniref:Uncharacterized protein n=1 Tax=marine sediment metagenome TaxID=412755 RepID=A0A0F9RQG8_9ZZZZ
MAITWNIAGLTTRFREDTGRRQTTDISDSDIADFINDYYVNDFPSDAKVDEFDTFFTQALSATDDGEYTIDSGVDRLDDPVTINGREIVLSRDREEFFATHHHHHFLHGHFHGARTNLHGQFEDEQFITNPNLVIGSSNSARVKHDSFDYEVQSKSYSKSSSEVALTGDAVPVDTFGAWSLKVDTDGTITVTAAGANGTGYDTARMALDALGTSDADTAYMGYVTVINTSGAFTPDTTTLDASGVTATFTDGRFENRAEPTSALLYGTQLFVRPKPNDIYQLKALQIAKRPTALSGATVIADPKHGKAIARGAAIQFLEPRGGQKRIDDLAFTTRFMFNSIRSDKIKRLLGQEIQRRN